MIIFFEKKRTITIFVIVCAILVSNLFSVEIYAEEKLAMYSGSYALTDAETGRLLAGKNEYNPMANASTTKILTCIVALENSNLDEAVCVTENAAIQPKVRLGMEAGEVYPMKDMLYALMLESYNDCAVAIAEHVAGSVEGFAKLMNQKALEIGCKDTYFITPNGLDKEQDEKFHHTTAADLCRIMAYCVWESPKKDIFLEITQTRSYSGSANGKNYTLVNRNSFLDQMDGVVSGKTGFTSKAGYCYVAALERDGEKYCIALLACGWPNNKTYKWKDATKLFNYGLDTYHKASITSETVNEEIQFDANVGEWSFKNMHQKMTLQVSGRTEEMSILCGENEEVTKEIILYTDTRLPIEKGQVLGVCNVYLEDMLLAEIPLVAQDRVQSWNFDNVLQGIFLKFLTIS